MRSVWLLGVFGTSAAAVAASAGGCGDDSSGTGGNEPVCSVEAQTGCANGTHCEEVEGAEAACFAPLTVEGRVVDLVDESGVSDALVVALDETGRARSASVYTDTTGHYSLVLPAKRDADGRPLPLPFTLRVDAFRYVSFPETPRGAPQLDIAGAVADGGGGSGPGTSWLLVSGDTDVGLIPLTNPTGIGTVTGIVTGRAPGGTLIQAGTATGVADLDGDFTVFNVPIGEVNVSGYQSERNYTTATTTVEANQDAEGVVLDPTDDASAIVTGSVEVVGAPSKEVTVSLALEGSFDEARAVGESPPGLVTQTTSGAFSFQGVPDGIYVVLTSVEDDGLVHDADVSPTGTAFAHVTVAAGDTDVPTPLRIRRAIGIVSPGAGEIDTATGTPTFQWKDDANEDGYHVELFDLGGGLVWETSGDLFPGDVGTASLDYGGPELDIGAFYQFRVTSSSAGKSLSTTEDLRGVFQYQ